MEHSVKQIGKSYEELSNMRKDENPFNANDFLAFAKQNIKKYSLVQNGDDFSVTTWFSDSLINDYWASISNKK